MKDKKKAARETGTLTDGKTSTQPKGTVNILPSKGVFVNCARLGRQKVLFLRERAQRTARDVGKAKTRPPAALMRQMLGGFTPDR